MNVGFDYLTPKTTKEACFWLSKYGNKAKVIAGGTDLLVAVRDRKITPQCIIDLKAIPDLDYIHYTDRKGLRIGALATIYDVESSPMIQERFPILASAAQQMASPQIRNMGTMVGNLCNAAPSADLAPSLIGLEAKARISGLNGERVVTVEEFFVGPGENVLQTGEILTEIEVPRPRANTRGVYLKTAAGITISIAIVGVAVIVNLDAKGTNIVDARIVLGAVAPTPIRARRAEAIIIGKAINDELIEKAAQAAAEEAKPISDIRGSANYRSKMVKVLTNRAIGQVTVSA